MYMFTLSPLAPNATRLRGPWPHRASAPLQAASLPPDGGTATRGCARASLTQPIGPVDEAIGEAATQTTARNSILVHATLQPCFRELLFLLFWWITDTVSRATSRRKLPLYNTCDLAHRSSSRTGPGTRATDARYEVDRAVVPLPVLLDEGVEGGHLRLAEVEWRGDGDPIVDRREHLERVL